VKSGQIDQGYAVFGGKGIKYRVKRVSVGKERMEDDEVAAGAHSHGGQGAAPGTQLLHWH
jgi:hypothetical protein